MKKTNVEFQVKQMIQVLLGSNNLNGDMKYVLEELDKHDLLSENEINHIKQLMATKKGIASC